MLKLNFLFTIGFILLSTFSLKTYAQNCSQLPNGKYIVVYKENYMVYPVYAFEIDSNNFITIENGERTIHKLVKNEKCSFTVFWNENIDETKLSDYEKWVYNNFKKEAFYEIYKVERNYYYFRIIVPSSEVDYIGKFIKQ